MATWLVTGGAGFIGSAMVRMLLVDSDYHVVNIDKLTYAGNLESIPGASDHPRYSFEHVDICDADAVRACFVRHRPDAVLHLAAESHVDRSIDGPAAFMSTNVHGTFVVLDESLRHWRSLPAVAQRRFRFVLVSTDEVFGSLGTTGRFSESSPYAPNSPYAASKAAADHLGRAWWHTYGLPTVVTNCTNNYGPFQFPEKLIPLTIQCALAERAIAVYGDGNNVRDWLYVDDHVRALRLVMEHAPAGECYAIGGNNERRNIDVVRTVCGILDRLHPRRGGGSYAELITFVPDRPGHDRRYAMDASKLARDFGWSAHETFDSGLEKTVRWYLENQHWATRVLSGAYRGERLGQRVPV